MNLKIWTIEWSIDNWNPLNQDEIWMCLRTESDFFILLFSIFVNRNRVMLDSVFGALCTPCASCRIQMRLRALIEWARIRALASFSLDQVAEVFVHFQSHYVHLKLSFVIKTLSIWDIIVLNNKSALFDPLENLSKKKCFVQTLKCWLWSNICDFPFDFLCGNFEMNMICFRKSLKKMKKEKKTVIKVNSSDISELIRMISKDY